MGHYLIKVSPDEDLYLEWSSIVEAPISWGSREYMTRRSLRDGVPPGDVEERLRRTDATGTSAHPPFGCAWDDSVGEIYMQRGFIRRESFGELVRRYAAVGPRDYPDVDDLLVPFEG